MAPRPGVTKSIKKSTPEKIEQQKNKKKDQTMGGVIPGNKERKKNRRCGTLKGTLSRNPRMKEKKTG